MSECDHRDVFPWRDNAPHAVNRNPIKTIYYILIILVRRSFLLALPTIRSVARRAL